MKLEDRNGIVWKQRGGEGRYSNVPYQKQGGRKLLKEQFQREGIATAAVDFGGEFITSVTKLLSGR